MSDAAITAIVSGAVNIVGLIIGFLTLWAKLKYSTDVKVEKVEAKAQAVEDKLDVNTALTSEVKSSADKASLHVEGCDDRMQKLNAKLGEHEARISSMEVKLTAVADTLEKNIDSTRHEMRGHLQQVANKLDLIMLKGDTNISVKKTEGK